VLNISSETVCLTAVVCGQAAVSTDTTATMSFSKYHILHTGQH
jgi:hypothetical protein